MEGCRISATDNFLYSLASASRGDYVILPLLQIVLSVPALRETTSEAEPKSLFFHCQIVAYELIRRSSEHGNKVEETLKDRATAETGYQDPASASEKLFYMCMKRHRLNRFKGTVV